MLEPDYAQTSTEIEGKINRNSVNEFERSPMTQLIPPHWSWFQFTLMTILTLIATVFVGVSLMIRLGS